MSASNNWNNPDMYYSQDRSQSSMTNASGAVDPYSGAPVYGSNAAYGTAGSYGPSTYGAASYGSQQAYGAPGAAPNYYAAGPRTNTIAIIALVASCVCISGFFLAGIAGIVMGHIAVKQIKVTGESGLGLAKAALWVGYILTGLWVLFWVGYFLIFVVLIGGSIFITGVS